MLGDRMLNKLALSLRDFRDDTRGTVIIWLGAALLALLGMGALTVDMGYAYALRTKMQAATDAAALAAATDISDEDNARALAIAITNENLPSGHFGTVLSNSDITFGTWDEDTRTFAAGGAPADAVQVVMYQTAANGNAAPTFLSRVMGHNSLDISTSAVAITGTAAPPPCVMTLATSGSNSLYLDSDAAVDLTNCSIQVNSNSGNALNAQSNSQVSADETSVVGTYGGGGSHYSPIPTTGAAAGTDPFAGIAAPTFGGCNYNNTFVGDDDVVTLNPGVYCGGITLDNNADVTFAPGEYIVQNGQFEALSNVQMSGDGVSFYLADSSSTIFFDSNVSLDFTAPTTGDLAGMLFYQDPTASGTHRIDSNFVGGFEGAMYFPNGDFVSDSNSSLTGSSNCAWLIAQNIEFNSNASFDVNFDTEACSVPVPGSSGGGIALRQ